MSLFVDYDFDMVKVDRVLISDIASRTKKAKVLGLICDMIKSLGKSHVVEGLDDEASLNVLRGLGYTVYQGFYFHRPEALAHIPDLQVFPTVHGAA